MIKRLDLILNGKGAVGKSYDGLPYHLGQPLEAAVGRLVLCKPFLATAAVWLDSAARRCELRLRFCIRKPCPALGTERLSIPLDDIYLNSVGSSRTHYACSGAKDNFDIRFLGQRQPPAWFCFGSSSAPESGLAQDFSYQPRRQIHLSCLGPNFGDKL